MSAAATAAGYLYASGRLRGRGAREPEETNEPRPQQQPRQQEPRQQENREQIRVAVLPQNDEKPRRTPKIEYRTRKRWTVA
jgi:hypothetical protein